MTVPAIEPVKNHYGNGSNTQFDFDFYVENPSQLKVIKTNASNVDIVLEYGIDFDVDGLGSENGGYVTFPIQTSEHSVLSSKEVLSIQLDLPISQESEYGASDRLNLNAVEYSFDYVTRIIQMIARQIKRCVKVTEGSGINPDELINSIMEASENTTINSQSAKNSAQLAYDYLDNCIKLLQDTRDLLNYATGDLTQYTFTVTHNMFNIVPSDKELSGSELTGLAKQNEEKTYSDYPDAYLELIDDYSNGENKIFSDDEIETYCKSYTADNTGDFYIGGSDELDVDTEIFSDTALSTSLGIITSKQDSFTKKYTGEIVDFYIDGLVNLDKNVEVFEDKGLLVSLGTVENLKKISGYKYTGSKTGAFYLSSELKKGAKIYSDKPQTILKGTITNVGTQKSDKYSINTLGNCFVSENSTLAVGTKIYSDEARTQQVATVTNKGSSTSSYHYYYYLHGGANNDAMFGTGPNGWGWVNPFYVYSKEPIPSADGTYNIPIYWDIACTNSAGYFTKKANGLYQFTGINERTSMVAPKYVDLISRSGSGTSSYIQIDGSSDRLEFVKLGSVSYEVISVNTDLNETYTLDEYYESDFIKIQNVDWQSYSEPFIDSSSVISVDDGTPENVVYKGIKTSQGIIFEYREAQDGHKIVDSKYKNQLDSYILTNGTSEYYLIDTDNKKFRTPIYDENKHIYICVGNAQIKKAQINNVTRSELNSELQKYAKQADVLNIMEYLGYTDSVLDEILGE